MKKIIIFNLVLLFLASCSQQFNQSNQDLIFTIKNKSIKDSIDVNVEVKNKSLLNYYLLIDRSQLYSSNLFTSSYAKQIYFSIEDQNNNKIENKYIDHGCDYLDKSNNKKSIIKNLLKIKAGETVSFKIPFLIKTKVDDYCWHGYKEESMIKDKQYYVKIIANYFPEDINSQTKFNKDSLKQMGYELYNKTIESNRVPLELN